MSYFVGIDVGTSGIKAGAMDQDGKLHFISYASYSLHQPMPGWIEVDPEEIWEQVISLIAEVTHNVQQSGGTVTAISFSTFCNASVLMDHKGNNIGKGILYMDHRSKQEAEWVKQTVAEEKLFSITGNRMEPGMISISSLLWVKRNRAEDLKKAYKWGHLPTFLLAKMTGDFVLDWTQASLTGLFDVSNYQWSDELCDAFGIEKSLLPRIIGPGEIVDWLDPRLADLLGIPQIPIVAGAADTACSTFALGIRPGEVFESVGTSDVLTVVSTTNQTFDRRFLNRAHVLPGQWLSHGAMSTPGLAIQWFYNEFLQGEGPLQEVFETLPTTSPTGSNGVLFLPYMHGERSPLWDPNARGLFVGLSLNTSKADMTRAILEGCSFGMRQLLDIIHDEFRINPSVIPCVGGGAKNSLWCQIKANVLNTEIKTMEVKETALLGACFLAAYALKALTLQEIYTLSVKKVSEKRKYTPHPSDIEKYGNLYSLFKELYPSIKHYYQQATTVFSVL